MTINLRNYSTRVPATQTIAEIETSLVRHGVSDIWKQFDASRNVIALCFAVITEYGKISFKLSVDIEAVHRVIADQKKSGGIKGISQAQASDMVHTRNVAWRILKDLIDTQMALVEVRMLKIEQVFLSDIWDTHIGKTFFELTSDKKFTGLLLEAQHG